MMGLSAKKGEKCPCGKRATATLMSVDGQRALMPCCMKCGLICMEYDQRRKADSEAAGLTPELRRWFATDSGLSSKTIASVLVPELRRCLPEGDFRTPADPSDFGRCYRLLKIIPKGRERLGEVAAKFPEWSGLVKNWGELTDLYEEELPSGEAPKLYARIKQLTGTGMGSRR